MKISTKYEKGEKVFLIVRNETEFSIGERVIETMKLIDSSSTFYIVYKLVGIDGYKIEENLFKTRKELEHAFVKNTQKLLKTKRIVNINNFFDFYDKKD